MKKFLNNLYYILAKIVLVLIVVGLLLALTLLKNNRQEKLNRFENCLESTEGTNKECDSCYQISFHHEY